jgi:hypothetical protein
MSVQADEDVSVIGEVATSNKQIDFYTTDGGSGAKIRFAADILTLDYAGTVIYRNFYSRVKISQTIKDDSVIINTVVMMERTDQDFTLGYFLGGGVSVFAGYKHGVFEAFVTGDQASDAMRARFIDNGAFAGVGYSFPVGKGAMSLSLAYADMDGEIEIKSTTSEITTGDTTGYSFSLNWNTPITETTNFVFGLNSTRYDFDDQDLVIGGYDFSTEQSFDSVSLGLVHYF